jgi:hypothetical protein
VHESSKGLGSLINCAVQLPRKGETSSNIFSLSLGYPLIMSRRGLLSAAYDQRRGGHCSWRLQIDPSELREDAQRPLFINVFTRQTKIARTRAAALEIGQFGARITF